jgi:hypothetical protein
MFTVHELQYLMLGLSVVGTAPRNCLLHTRTFSKGVAKAD